MLELQTIDIILIGINLIGLFALGLYIKYKIEYAHDKHAKIYQQLYSVFNDGQQAIIPTLDAIADSLQEVHAMNDALGHHHHEQNKMIIDMHQDLAIGINTILDSKCKPENAIKEMR